MTAPDPDQLARALNNLLYGHMERRVCSAEAPMAHEDKDRFRWSHPDADVGARLPVANAVDVCHCRHCGLTFTSFPRPQ